MYYKQINRLFSRPRVEMNISTSRRKMNHRFNISIYVALTIGKRCIFATLRTPVRCFDRVGGNAMKNRMAYARLATSKMQVSLLHRNVLGSREHFKSRTMAQAFRPSAIGWRKLNSAGSVAMIRPMPASDTASSNSSYPMDGGSVNPMRVAIQPLSAHDAP